MGFHPPPGYQSYNPSQAREGAYAPVPAAGRDYSDRSRAAAFLLSYFLGFFGADRFYVGWLFRSIAQPRIFIPRFWSARTLPWLMWKYRDQLPPMEVMPPA